MVHGHKIAIVYCHDTGKCHEMCDYRGIVPVVAHEMRCLIKTCMLPSRECKYQNELASIPWVPVYIVPEERPQGKEESAGTDKQQANGKNYPKVKLKFNPRLHCPECLQFKSICRCG